LEVETVKGLSRRITPIVQSRREGNSSNSKSSEAQKMHNTIFGKEIS
jgi:hypothetical protein